MARFLLAAPEHRTLRAEYIDGAGKAQHLDLKFRVLTCADVGRIQAQAGLTWLESLHEAQDTDLAIGILAGQVANRAEVEAALGADVGLEQGLKNAIPYSQESLDGVMGVLVGLYEDALLDGAKKKSRLRRRRLIRIGWIILLSSSCAGAAVLLAWGIYWP